MESTGHSSTYTTPELVSDHVSVEVNIKSLLDAGAHFGHQKERWNPRMLPFIYGLRNNTHIINLDMTLKNWERARKFVRDITERGGSMLFVGTKVQARDIVRAEAERAGCHYVTTRWLGGTLTNFQTIKFSIDRMKKLEDLLAEAEKPETKIRLVKKERLNLSRQLAKLEASLGGIRNLKRPPDVLFIVDVIKEAIAVAEARRLHIPVVALVDTNADPGLIDFPIPSNDDAAKTVKLFSAAMADAVIDGRAAFEAKIPHSGGNGGGNGGGEGGHNRKNGANGGAHGRDDDQKDERKEEIAGKMAGKMAGNEVGAI